MEALLTESSVRIEQLEEFVKVQGQSQATKMENLDQVNVEVTRLRGAIEVLEFDLAKMKEERSSSQLQQERRQLHDERRLRQLEDFLGVDTPPPPTNQELGVPGEPIEGDPLVGPVDTDPQDPVEVEGTVPDTAQGKLELAAEHMRAGRQAVARAILTRAKAEHADTREISEIDFRIAETYLNEKNFSKAALSFKQVIDNHPGSRWASWSMLRQGQCFEGLGQTDNARLFYDGVIQRFPKTDAAKDAKKRLGR